MKNWFCLVFCLVAVLSQLAAELTVFDNYTRGGRPLLIAFRHPALSGAPKEGHIDGPELLLRQTEGKEPQKALGAAADLCPVGILHSPQKSSFNYSIFL